MSTVRKILGEESYRDVAPEFIEISVTFPDDTETLIDVEVDRRNKKELKDIQEKLVQHIRSFKHQGVREVHVSH